MPTYPTFYGNLTHHTLEKAVTPSVPTEQVTRRCCTTTRVGCVHQAHPALVVTQQCRNTHSVATGAWAYYGRLEGGMLSTVTCNVLQRAVPCLAILSAGHVHLGSQAASGRLYAESM